MQKERLQPASLPEPTAPFSLGIKAGDLVFVAGQVAVDKNGKLIGGEDAGKQARQVMENVKAVVEASGAAVDDIVKLTIFVTDMADLPAVLAVRKAYFNPPYPASTAVEVGALAHPDWMVEIEAIAVKGCSAGN